MLLLGMALVFLIIFAYWYKKTEQIAFCILMYIFVIALMIIVLGVQSGDYGTWTQGRTIILTKLEENSNEVKYVKNLPNAVIFNYGESKFKITKTENSLVEIIETDGEEAYMLMETRQGKAQMLFTFVSKPTQVKYIFYVPKGTVIEEENIKEFKLSA